MKKITYEQAQKILSSAKDIICEKPNISWIDILEIICHSHLGKDFSPANTAFDVFPELKRYKPENKRDREEWFSNDGKGSEQKIRILRSIERERFIRKRIESFLEKKVLEKEKDNIQRLTKDLYLIAENKKSPSGEYSYISVFVTKHEGRNDLSKMPIVVISEEGIEFAVDCLINQIVDYYNEKGEMV